MSAEALIKYWPELEGHFRCWAQAVWCPCTMTGFGDCALPNHDRIARRVLDGLEADPNCYHRCNAYADEKTLGLCHFHYEMYLIDVFGIAE